MKKIVYGILLVLTSTSNLYAQNVYHITVNGKPLGEKIYLLNAENQTVIDSASLNNGIYTFSGQTAEPVVGAISAKPSMRGAALELIIDKTPLTLTLDDKGFPTSAKGSADNVKYANYLAEEGKVMRKLMAFEQHFQELLAAHNNDQKQIPDSTMSQLEAEYEEAYGGIMQIDERMMTENPDNLIPVYQLIYNADAIGYDKIEPFLNTYKYKDRVSLQPTINAIQKEKCKLPGSMFQDIRLYDVQGIEHSLSDYIGKGKYVLVDFWASWCGPCRQEMPNVKAAYEKYHDKGFEIVGISLDNKKEAWEKAFGTLGITWPQLSDLKGWDSAAASLYNIRAIPATILYDTDGKVIKSNLRGEELQAKLAELIK